MKILMMIYPGMTPLDFMGPLQVWSVWPEAEIQVVWKTTAAVATDTPVQMIPTHSFDNCFAQPDIVFVPGGGKPTIDLMNDQDVLNFIRAKSESAKWVTSVCTGALLLAAAGLLQGKKATTHWAALAVLKDLGVDTQDARYVIDGRFATGGGVTAGIDFGLALLAEMAGRDVAEAVQLALEYNPQPPFNSGSPATAKPETLDRVLKNYLSMNS